MTPTADKLAAARGLANVPPEVGLELLVALSRDESPAIRAAAGATLKSWGSEKLQPLLARRSVSQEVIGHFLRPENLRPDLLPTLLSQRQVPQQPLAELAAAADLETVKVLLDHIDALRTPALTALKSNSAYVEMHGSRLSAMGEGLVFEPSFLELLIAEAQLEDERHEIQRLSEEEEAKCKQGIIDLLLGQNMIHLFVKRLTREPQGALFQWRFGGEGRRPDLLGHFPRSPSTEGRPLVHPG